MGGRSVAALSMIERALNQAEMQRAAIDCIAVGLGPGSYAGIRAAISLAQGWHLARSVKLLGISSAECLAYTAQVNGVRGAVTFVIDAQRGEYYLGTYTINETEVGETEPLHIAAGKEVDARMERGAQVMGPDAGAFNARPLFPEATVLAKIAASLANVASGEQLEPIYLRETNFVKAPVPRVPPGYSSEK